MGSVLTTLAYASLKSHMTPGHNTNSALDKDLHQISKEEMGTDNRELDTLVESYKIRVGNDIGKASLTLTEEQIDQAVIKIKALRANAAGFGETEDERRERIIRETKSNFGQAGILPFGFLVVVIVRFVFRQVWMLSHCRSGTTCCR